MTQNRLKPTPVHSHTQPAVLVTLIAPDQSIETVTEHADELALLGLTLGLHPIGRFYQRRITQDPTYMIGKGKLREIQIFLQDHPKACVLFNEELGPTQVRNLTRVLKVQIYDRSLLILNIFQKRARTAEARLQVQLARYEYLFPRLTRLWTHLERQRGGTSTRGGAGEKEIETDRRQIKHQITVLRKKLRTIHKQSSTQRKGRVQMQRIALVGYTNAGKSTLMNALAGTRLEAKDKLFSTVDTTVRRLKLGKHTYLLSDTVGFIRKLPHHLVESFQSTLAEATEADCLLHVVDISHPCLEEHIHIVEDTLSAIGVSRRASMFLIFNKLDQLNLPEERLKVPTIWERIERFQTTYSYQAHLYHSTKQPNSLDKLRKTLQKHMTLLDKLTRVRVP